VVEDVAPSNRAYRSGPRRATEGPVTPKIAGRSKAGGRLGALVLGVFRKKARIGRLEESLLGTPLLPEKIRTLRTKLYQKAKSEPKYRFYCLYDKVYRPDILTEAYHLSKLNKGGPGVDGVTYEDIEARPGGAGKLVEELHEELKNQTYRPKPVKRAYISKESGTGERPLGIPCIRDRVVQTAAKLVLEPIFEADFTDNAYGYRPGRGVHDALKDAHGKLRAGYVDVVDADLSKYFDTIPHAELMKSVARRVSDGKMLHLIKMWLQAPVEEKDEEGRPRLTGGKDHHQGTPQGGVISPLLANIYMRRFLLAWEQLELGRKLRAHVVNYADDFVILCRRTAGPARQMAERILTKMKLTVNQEKTRICNAWREPFHFLGYTLGTCYAGRTGEPYLGARPAKPRLRRLFRALRDHLSPRNVSPLDEVIRKLNQRLQGWANFFSYGTIAHSYEVVDHYTRLRLRKFLCRRHKVPGHGTRRFPDGRLHAEFGLVRLTDVLRQRRSNAPGETRPRAGYGKTVRPVR
jgi:RNA-directed DNA polymerase